MPAMIDTAPARHEIAFVNADLPDLQNLLADLRPDIEVLLLDPAADGIAQLAQALAGRSDVTAIHLLGHGAEGLLQLGDTRFDADYLEAHAAELATIGAALTAEGDILVYGCDTGAGTAGAAFVQTLADLTGADVAASDDLTGGSARGGDWALEVNRGNIETPSAVGAAGAAYGATLAIETGPVYTQPGAAYGFVSFATSAGGTLYMAQKVGETALSLKEWTGAGWTEIGTLSAATAGVSRFYDDLSLAVTASGKLDIVVHTATDITDSVNSTRRVSLGEFDAQTHSWSALKQIDQAVHPSGYKDFDDQKLAIGPTGSLYAVYNYHESSDTAERHYAIRYSSSSDGGTTWTTSDLVDATGDYGNLVKPQVFVDTAGNVQVFYVSQDNDPINLGNLYTMTKSAGSTVWSAPQKLAEGLNYDGYQVAADGAGHFYAAYSTQTYDGDFNVTSSTVAVVDNTGGSWHAGQVLISEARIDGVVGAVFADGRPYFLINSSDLAYEDYGAFLVGKAGSVWETGYRGAQAPAGLGTTKFGELALTADADHIIVVTEDDALIQGAYIVGDRSDFGLNAAPVVSGIDGDSTPFTPGATDLAQDAAYIDLQDGAAPVGVADADASDFIGGNITIVQSSGTANGRFEIDDSTEEIAAGSDSAHLGRTLAAGSKIFLYAGSWIEIGHVDATLDGQGGQGLKIVFTAEQANAQSAELIVRSLMYGASTAGARSFALTVDDGDGGVSTPSTFTMNGVAVVDTTAPTVSVSTDRVVFKAGDTALITFTFSEAPVGFALGDVSASGGTVGMLAATADPLVYTAVFTPTAGVQAFTGSVSVAAGGFTDAAGNSNPASTGNPAFSGDTRAPFVADANLSISGASGSGGAFHIGDTVTVAWNDSATGDNNGDTAGATVDFSQFGGGSSVVAVKSGNVWVATYTIVPGAIDALGRHPSIVVTDTAGNVTTHVASAAATVDNSAPVVTDGALSISGASGTNGAYIVGDTVTATWNNGSDGNGDVAAARFDFSQFGGGSSVAATHIGAVWIASSTIVAGALDAANRNVSVTVTDDAGNTSTVADSSNARVDSIIPQATAIALSGTPGPNATAVDFVLTFSEAVTHVDAADLALVFTGAASANIASVTGSGTTYTVHVDGIAGNGSLQVVLANAGTGIADLAGNAIQGGYTQGAVYSTAFNALPVIGSNGGGASASIDIAEKQRVVTTVAASDADGDTLVYSIGGGADAALFEIDATTGQLRFKATPAVGTPLDADHDNHYQVQVTAADGKGGSSQQALTVTVLADLDGDGTPDIDDNDIDNDGRPNTIEDAVPGANGGHGDGNGDGIADSAQINVASLPTTVTGNPYVTLAVGDDYTLSAVSAGAAPGGLPRGVKLPLGQLDFTIGHVANGATVEMSIYVDASQNVNGYYKQDNNGVWKNIAKSVTTVGSKTKITFDLTDGGVYDNDHLVNGSISDPGGVALIVPQITSNGGATSASVQVIEHGTAVTTVTASAVGPVSYAIVGGADAALFQVDGESGVLTFRSAPDYGHPLDQGDTAGNNTYVVQVRASDASGGETQTLTVGVVSAATPPQPPSTPTPVESTVDGVKITTGTQQNSDGSTSQVIEIPVVLPGRQESVGNNTVADIPLASSGGKAVLTAQVPAGYGLHVVGQATPGTAGTALTDLIREIKAHTSAGSSDQSSLTGGGSGFLGGLDASTPLLVKTIVPTIANGAQLPTEAFVINGLPSGAGGAQTALVIDTSGLSGTPHLQLQNVDFAAIIGAAHVTGGDGAQKVWGDSASQTIVLGADDDILHGGDGDDTVGSGAGDDQIFGDGGNDVVFGGSGNDTIDGGTGTDTVLLAGATRADYSLRFEHGVLVSTARTGDDGTDHIANVEVMQFAAADTSAAGTIGRVYEAALGRAADTAGREYWVGAHDAGMSLEAIAKAIVASSEALQLQQDSAAFVAALYHGALGRDDDAGGMAFWTAQLDAGTVTRAGLALQFADSAEKLAMPSSAQLDFNRSDVATVVRMYEALFDRHPDEGGINYWIGAHEDGLSMRALAQQFLASAESGSHYASLSDSQFVTALYQTALGHAPSAAEAALWNIQLAAGQITRGDVLLGVADSAEMVTLVGVVSTSIETV